MVEPVARSTSALDFPDLRISNACWARRPNTFEQFSTRMIGPPLPSLSVTCLLHLPATPLLRGPRLGAFPEPLNPQEMLATHLPVAKRHDTCFAVLVQLFTWMFPFTQALPLTDVFSFRSRHP